MKNLTKVKLINWHTFVNEEFSVSKNALITGENGTGKSTVMDAMQYVLTAGQIKFNKAASDIGSRTLESYVRCKTGIEGKEYLRNSDVISYIALEFYDDKSKTSQIVGAVIEIPAGGRPKKEFFQITESKISEIVFIAEKKVLSRSKFKDQLARDYKTAVFKENAADRKKLVSNALGVKDKYFDLLSRALAFKAIDNVYQFITDFLLKVDSVDIDSLRSSIQNYKKIEDRLKVCELEFEKLNKIITNYNDYVEINDHIEALDFAKEINQKNKNSYDIDCFLENKNTFEAELESARINISIQEKQLESSTKQLDEIKIARNEFDDLRLKETLQKEIDSIKNDIDKIKNKYLDLIEAINSESKLVNKLKLYNGFVDYVSKRNFTTNKLTRYINEIMNYFDNTNELLQEQIKNVKNCIADMSDTLKNKKNIYNSLKNNKQVYRVEVDNLISTLKDELFKHYGKQIVVKPLCEYLEVIDDSWRNAVEGYLNTQRFDIIIDPEYFDYAIKVYEAYKEEKSIYGVGIVEVGKLKRYDNVTIEGSLLEKIEVNNIYAKRYINMLLEKVKCANKLDELKLHKIAITKTCMLYKNYTVRAINPKIYKIPYIGLKAIEIQRLALEKTVAELEGKIKNNKVNLRNLSEQKSIIDESNAHEIVHRLDLIDEYNLALKQYNETKERQDALKIDSSAIAIDEEFKKLNELVKNKNNEIKTLYERRGKLRQEIDINNANLANSTNQYNILVEKISKYELDNHEVALEANKLISEYSEKNIDHNKIENKIENSKNDYKQKINLYESNIHTLMNEYNNEFNIGFQVSINEIEVYKDRLHKLKDIEISRQLDLSTEAKIKSEDTFRSSFISGLNEKIENAKKDISNLNKSLAKRDFNGETYEFIISPTRKEGFKDYYNIIRKGQDYGEETLFSSSVDESQRKIMDQLFNKLANVENDKETEKALMEYTDYRNYLDYDIKIKYENGDYALFSKVNKEKSGGETQTPFYVIMAASFEQVIKERRNDEDFACVVLFDEAFNNMDENRINEMIKFYNEREIQTFIAVPPQRSNNIAPYVNTILLTIKQNDTSFVEVITNE